VIAAISPATRFDRLRLVGLALSAIGIAIAVVAGAWPLAIGIVFGAAVTIGWAGQLIRRSLVQPISERLQSVVADRSSFLIRAVLGTVPPVIVGLVALLIGIRYPAALVIAGIFLTMAVSFLLMYLGIWSVRPGQQPGR
jgi:hypothetical protein